MCYVGIKRYFYSIKEILFGLIYDVKFLKGLIVMGDGLVIFDLEVFESLIDIDYVLFFVI